MATKPVTERLLHCGTLLTAGMGIALSGCTGTDLSIAMGPNGPIPPADIGSTSTLGAPPASASALADAAPVAAAPSGNVAAAPLPPASPVRGSPLAPPSQRLATASSSSNLRWNTGPQPVGYPARSSPRDTPPPSAQSEVASLPEPVDDGSAVAPLDETPPSPVADEAPRQQASLGAPRQPSAASGRTEVQFLPVVGAPQREAELLARALSEESQQAGVRIRPASGPVAPLRLKGYFSAFTDGGETVLVYVWDVLDENDQRIRRIQGQERVAGTNSDPWSQVDLDALRKVARETFRQAASLDADVG
ncbi:hypothetical protein [Jiella avicenniae]|uniref:Lipoprotein n=1 Tax=Jiella avicenniae TaxID=2907202 RepID=A0A9X1NYJ2_9HYPH|nr:hypothetical protein [Jiella avicenniae]MCE7026746.1 hypothetical protein [Jiella avicenniae]